MVKTFSPKQFTTQWMLLLLKQNYFWLDVESTKLFRFQILNISLSLQILYQLQDISLICLPIYFDCIPSLFFKILEPSLIKGLLTPLCSGIVLTMTSGLLIQWSIKKPNSWKLILFFYAGLYGNLARNKSVVYF